MIVEALSVIVFILMFTPLFLLNSLVGHIKEKQPEIYKTFERVSYDSPYIFLLRLNNLKGIRIYSLYGYVFTGHPKDDPETLSKRENIRNLAILFYSFFALGIVLADIPDPFFSLPTKIGFLGVVSIMWGLSLYYQIEKYKRSVSDLEGKKDPLKQIGKTNFSSDRRMQIEIIFTILASIPICLPRRYNTCFVYVQPVLPFHKY